MRCSGQNIARVLVSLSLVVMVGCGDGPDTAVRLQLEYPESWQLDQVEVSFRAQTRTAAMARAVLVRMPDTLVGEPLTLRVRGLLGGSARAHALVEVTPERGRTIDVTVELTRLVCGDWCAPGAQACRGDGVVVCAETDDGCTAWGAPGACGADAPYCSLGYCSSDCVDECVAGEMRCAGPGGLQTCGQHDSDTCQDWSAPAPCEGGQGCWGSSCRDACVDECEPGTTRCDGDGVVRCGDHDADGCTDWGPVEPCAEGSCSGGACATTCVDECEMTSCNGVALAQCGQLDSDPCLDLSAGVSCASDDPCRVGRCEGAACIDGPVTCDEPPEPVCVDADTLRQYAEVGTCESDSDGCVYAETLVDCPGGCEDGVCAGCTPKTCVELGAECGEVPDGCGGTLTCGACAGVDSCGGAGVPNSCGCAPAAPTATILTSIGSPVMDVGPDGVLQGIEHEPGTGMLRHVVRDGDAWSSSLVPGITLTGIPRCAFDVDGKGGLHFVCNGTYGEKVPGETWALTSRFSGNDYPFLVADGTRVQLLHQRWEGYQDGWFSGYQVRNASSTWAYGDPQIETGRGVGLALRASGAPVIAIAQANFLCGFKTSLSDQWADLVVRELGSDGGWTAGQAIDSLFGGCWAQFQPKLAIHDEAVYLAYHRSDGVLVVAVRDGGVWSESVVPLSITESSRHGIAVDPAGGIHLAVALPDDKTLRYAHRPPGGSWDIRLVASSTQNGFAGWEGPGISVDAHGVIHIWSNESSTKTVHARGQWCP